MNRKPIYEPIPEARGLVFGLIGGSLTWALIGGIALIIHSL